VAREVKYKVLRMSQRRAAESREAFIKRWCAEHPKRAVVTLATGEIALGGAELPFDGMSATYFPTERAAREAAAQFSGDLVMACDEHAMGQKEEPKSKIKIVRTVYRRRDLTHQEFKDYWLNNHSKLEDRVIAESPVQKIIATFALPEAGRDPVFDGMVELYFAAVEDIRATFAGPVPAMMRKDEENFVQMDAPAIRVVCEEVTP
jgi:uncharacterized protein (TIGR02118 family)